MYSPKDFPHGYYLLPDSRYARYFQEYGDNRYPSVAGFYPGYVPQAGGHHPVLYHPGEHPLQMFVPDVRADFHPLQLAAAAGGRDGFPGGAGGPEINSSSNGLQQSQNSQQQQNSSNNHHSSRAESISSSEGSASSSSKKSFHGKTSRQVTLRAVNIANQNQPKFMSPIKQNQQNNLQLAEIEEMAQQAQRMTVQSNKPMKRGMINGDGEKLPRGRRGSSCSGESGGSSNDSGGCYNEDRGEFDIPSEDLIAKITDQVEFYLSDNYLAKDKYLLRQIRCKSEGYISIKLMTSFKKVKKLTRDWRVVRYALQQSPALIVSPEGFRVKRNNTLPDTLRRPRLLTSVVAIRVPEDYDSVDHVTQLFRSYGDIGLVRLLRPGKEVPSDLRNYATQVPDIGNSLCAVVDFEGSDAALKAVRELKERFANTGMRLALLGPRMRRTLYRQDRLASQGKLGSESGGNESGAETISSADTGEHCSGDSGRGHSDHHSEISDDISTGKISPGPVIKTEPTVNKSKRNSVVREPTGPGEKSQGFRMQRKLKQ
jgi:hypothetical protein